MPMQNDPDREGKYRLDQEVPRVDARLRLRGQVKPNGFVKDVPRDQTIERSGKR